ARFTFSKDVTPRFRLVYSFGLNSPEAQYYQLQYRFRPGREALITVRRLDDGTFTYGAGQRLLLGGPKRAAPAELGADVTEAELTKRLNSAKVGKSVSYFDLQNDSDRLREYLIQHGYLE